MAWPGLLHDYDIEGGPHAVVHRVDPSALLLLLVAAAALPTDSRAAAETMEQIAVFLSWQRSSCNEWALWEARLL